MKIKSIKQEKRKNTYLAMKAEDLLFLSKRYKKLSYDEAFEQHTNMFYLAMCIIEKKVWEREEKEKWAEAYMEKRVKLYRLLPQEIWDTVENERKFCLGFMSKKTKRRFLIFLLRFKNKELSREIIPNKDGESHRRFE